MNKFMMSDLGLNGRLTDHCSTRLFSLGTFQRHHLLPRAAATGTLRTRGVPVTLTAAALARLCTHILRTQRIRRILYSTHSITSSDHPHLQILLILCKQVCFI